MKCDDCKNDIKEDYRESVDGERFLCSNCYELDRQLFHDGIYGKWTVDGQCSSIIDNQGETMTREQTQQIRQLVDCGG